MGERLSAQSVVQAVVKFGTASATTSGNGSNPGMAIDGTTSTWWSSNTTGAQLTLGLANAQILSGVELAFYKGDQRQQKFTVMTSADGSTWTTALSNQSSSGTTTGPQRFSFPANVTASAVKIELQGVYYPATGASSATGTVAEATAVAVVDTSVTHTYYVDCAGSDSNSGTSAAAPWRSLSKANVAILFPGDRVLFKNGCSWTGTLSGNRNGNPSAPITYSNYGDAALPTPLIKGDTAVSISGSYQVFDHLQVTTNTVPLPDPTAVNCKTTPTGWRSGFEFQSGASNNTVQYSKGYGLTAAVHLGSGANNNKVLHNTLTNNTIMSTNTSAKYDDDSGAWGLLVNSNNNEIAYNSFSGNTACSEDYGVEGASMEVYSASSNFFHHNTSVNDTTLTELGGTSSNPSRYNRYEYNIYAPLNTGGRGESLVLRGYANTWGDNAGTVFNHNTIFNANLGVFCGGGCDATILSLHDNIIVTRSAATKDTVWTDGPIDQGGNVFYQLDGQYKVTIAGVKDKTKLGSSVWGDPKLVDPWGENFNITAATPLQTAGALLP